MGNKDSCGGPLNNKLTSRAALDGAGGAYWGSASSGLLLSS